MTSFLDRQTISDALAGTRWGPVQVVEATASTNADLAAAARVGAQEGSVLITGWQQAGRGRFDRVWQTPPDTCVAMSVLLRPGRGLASWGWLSLLAGLAVLDGIEAASGLKAQLKWPNDVLIGDRKVCGILSEAVHTDAGLAAVLGMGINVRLASDELPVPTATSLSIEGSDASGADVAASVLRVLEGWYGAWASGQDLSSDYRKRCSSIGRRVRVELPSGHIEGDAVDVDAHGSLVVDTGSGRRSFAAGDVVHLRGEK